MATEFSSPQEIRAWAESVREKATSKNNRQKNGSSSPNLPESLKDDLLEAVDLLIDQVQEKSLEAADPQHAASPAVPAERLAADIVETMADTLDSTLAGWQASIASSFSQSSTGALNRHLKQAEQLVAELKDQQQCVQEQQRELDRQQAELLRKQAKTTRQRRSIARDLQGRKNRIQLEWHQERQTFESTLRNELDTAIRQNFEGQIELLEQRNLEQKHSVIELQSRLEDSRHELSQQREAGRVAEESWHERLAQAQQHAEHLQEEASTLRTEQQNAGNTESQQASQAAEQISQLESRLLTADRQIEELTVSLEKCQDAESDLTDLLAEHETLQRENEELTAAQSASESAQHAQELEACEELRAQIERLETDLQETQAALEASQSNPSSDNADQANEWAAQLDDLEQQLVTAQEELTDLRSQNSDLASQLAKKQVSNSGNKPHVQFDQEALSWEERKQLILQQLEDECDVSSENDLDSQAKRVDVEQILETTQAEIDRRDEELADLRSVLEQQSETKQGVAIGAAAIAQMMDEDDLISQERQKLKDIQQEWEEKLRQAEIDLSMERAKLARERRQLDSELKDREQERPHESSNPEPAGKGRTRKWLEHLGLREENDE